MIRTYLRTALAVCLALAAAGTGSAQNAKEKKLLADVADRLLAVCEQPKDVVWPPDIKFEEDRDINAYAALVDKDGKPAQLGGKLHPRIRIYTGLMTKVVEIDKPGAADRLAVILGHELGHIVKGHCPPLKKQEKTEFLKVILGSAEEIEADLYGLELMLKAGYDMKRGLEGIERMKKVLQELGANYSSFEGLGKDHPSWDERLEKADKDKAVLWKSMA